MTNEQAIHDLYAIKEFFEEQSGATPLCIEYVLEMLKERQPMVIISMKVGESEKNFLQELAEKHNCTIDEIVREAIQEYWGEEYYEYFEKHSEENA